MADLKMIQEDAFEKLKECKTVEDVIELGKQYGIEVTPEDAEAALAAGGEDLVMYAFGRCENKDKCGDCEHEFDVCDAKTYMTQSYCYKGGREGRIPVSSDQEACESFSKRKLPPENN